MTHIGMGDIELLPIEPCTLYICSSTWGSNLEGKSIEGSVECCSSHTSGERNGNWILWQRKQWSS